MPLYKDDRLVISQGHLLSHHDLIQPSQLPEGSEQAGTLSQFHHSPTKATRFTQLKDVYAESVYSTYRPQTTLLPQRAPQASHTPSLRTPVGSQLRSSPSDSCTSATTNSQTPSLPTPPLLPEGSLGARIAMQRDISKWSCTPRYDDSDALDSPRVLSIATQSSYQTPEFPTPPQLSLRNLEARFISPASGRQTTPGLNQIRIQPQVSSPEWITTPTTPDFKISKLVAPPTPPLRVPVAQASSLDGLNMSGFVVTSVSEPTPRTMMPMNNIFDKNDNLPTPPELPHRSLGARVAARARAIRTALGGNTRQEPPGSHKPQLTCDDFFDPDMFDDESCDSGEVVDILDGVFVTDAPGVDGDVLDQGYCVVERPKNYVEQLHL